MKLLSFLPFLSWFRLVTKESLKADITAGFTGAVIVLPQGVAFATIAGLPPEYGLYTAMVTPIIAALFGSSFHLVSGPTTAISILVFSSVSHHAAPGSPEFISIALTLTLLAGVYQLAFGLARMGAAVNFVSHTVVIAFTAGAGILIATSQISNITGLSIPRGDTFLHSWGVLFDNLESINLHLLMITIVTFSSALLSKRLMPKSPNLLIGMVVGSVLALILKNYDSNIKFVAEIPTQLPPMTMPDLSFSTIRMLAPEAFAVALLGLIEAVSISRAIANKSNQRIDSNQEFIGQGLSNIVGSFFSSYAGSGSFTRSGVNYDTGARTPLSAIFAALTLMIIVMLIGPLTTYLPTAAMGGVILLVAIKLVDFRHILQILKFSKSESTILSITFIATLFLDLEFAIYSGVLLSLVLFLAKTSTPTIPTLSFDFVDKTQKRRLIDVVTKPVRQCPQLKMLRIDMPIYFGSVNHVLKRLSKVSDDEKIYHILIDATRVSFIDLTGAEALVTENNRLKQLGGGLYFVGMNATLYEFSAKSCFIRKIGNRNFFDGKTEAISGVYKRLSKGICSKCQARIFKECS